MGTGKLPVTDPAIERGDPGRKLQGDRILARIPNDGLLTHLANSSFTPLRRWAARKAAERALHCPALRGAPSDPYVLARLGLYPLALADKAEDDMARFGHGLARAALGIADGQALDSFAAVGATKRALAARLVALHDGEAALALLNRQDLAARAACLLSLGRSHQALSLAERISPQSRESAAIIAHSAICAGDHHRARQVLNEMFEHDGLCAPLDESPQPFSMTDLEGEAPPVIDGPKVSVIIPYRNAAETLATAVGSMTRQSWRNIELLLVDDRSTDGGPEIAKHLASMDGRIMPLTNARSAGVYGARNTAIEAATGSYIMFLDADDWSPVERIARQMAHMDEHALTIANHIRMDGAGRPVAPRIFPLVRPVPITMFLRRDTLLAAGPFDEVATGADSEMLARLEMINGRSSVSRDQAVLLVARWHTGSLSRDADGGLLGDERYRYRAEWMFRHAGLDAPCLPDEQRAE